MRLHAILTTIVAFAVGVSVVAHGERTRDEERIMRPDSWNRALAQPARAQDNAWLTRLNSLSAYH